MTKKWPWNHQERGLSGLTGGEEYGRKGVEAGARGGSGGAERSLSCRMRSEALTWTLKAKAAANRQKKDRLEEKNDKHLAKGVRRLKVRKGK